jgi:ferric-dicitrate binding protein FerR (iron transport regulator)
MTSSSLMKRFFTRGRSSITSALVLICTMFILSGSDARCAESIGRITSVSGDVLCTRPGVFTGQILKNGDTIQVADLVETGKTSKVELLLTDESLIHIMPGSTLRISQYAYQRTTNRRSAVAAVKRGTVRFFFAKELAGGSSLTIETDQALIQASQADVIVTESDRRTELFTLAGSIGIRNSSKLVVGNVRAGENQSVVVEAKLPPTNPSAIPLPQRRKFTKDARQF